jgi:hypothetical protein
MRIKGTRGGGVEWRDDLSWDEQEAWRLARLKEAWRFEIKAKEAGLWVDLIPIECPSCRRKGEWPKRMPLPTCGDCMRYGSPAIRMRKRRPEGPKPEPKPKPPSTRELLAEIVERLERLEGKNNDD